MTCVNVFRSLHPFRFDQVPLSCVPPRTRQELNGSIAALMNWIVLLSFLSMWASSIGTRESSRLQPTLSAPVTGPPVMTSRPSSSHCDEMLVNVPLVRMTPPSEPSKIWVGLPGLMTIACWSGWMPSAGVYTSSSYQPCAQQKSCVAKYGFAVSREVRHCQPVVNDAGYVCVAGSGGVHAAPVGVTDPCDPRSVAAGSWPLSVRQKLAA